MPLPAVEDLLARYQTLKTARSSVEAQWRMNAAYCLPREYLSWTTEGGPVTSQRTAMTTRYAYDGTGVKSVPRYGSVLNRMLTPEGQKYHLLVASDKNLMKRYAVRQFFDELTNLLFEMRHAPRANFKQAQGEVYTQLGVYGTGCKSTMWRKPSPTDRTGGFAYKSWAIRDVFLVVNSDGIVIGQMRRFWMTARQFKAEYPNEMAPPSVANCMQGDAMDTTYHEFIHVVLPRDDYQEGSLSVRRLPLYGCVIAVKDKSYVGSETGFAMLPYQTPRTFTVSGDPYGFAPAEFAFPALGTANAMKKTLIRQGHKAVAPTLLANDDGLMSGRIDTRPDSIIYGGIDSQGRKMVAALDNNSKFQIGQDLLEDERTDIGDNFLSVLFRILEQQKDITAAQVYETIAKEASLVAPLMGRLQSEDLAMQIERELVLLAEHGKFPQVPPELIEAQGQYSVTYTSPLARAMYAEEVSGFMRLSEIAINIAANTQNPEPLDHFEWDTAIPEMSVYMNVPTGWMSSPEKVAKKREDRQAQQDTEQAVKAAPAAASVVASAMKTQQGAMKGPQA